jgi:hypothetical protein
MMRLMIWSTPALTLTLLMSMQRLIGGLPLQTSIDGDRQWMVHLQEQTPM